MAALASSGALMGRTVIRRIIQSCAVAVGRGLQAEDARLDRLAVLKFMPEDLARERQAEVRFGVTARSVRALSTGGCDAK